MTIYNTTSIFGPGGLQQAAGPFVTGDTAFAEGYQALGDGGGGGGGGEFYFQVLADVFTGTVHVEGAGMNEPDPAGYGTRTPADTLLVFPKNTTGLRIRSSAPLDLPGAPPHSAERTSIRNLTIWCKELDATGDGVYATVIYSLENVTVENFAGHGVHNRGSYLVTGDGNVSASLFSNVTVSQCGIDGFHSEGADATVMTFVNCTATVNRRYGVYDETRMHAYLGVHSEGNGAPGLAPPPRRLRSMRTTAPSITPKGRPTRRLSLPATAKARRPVTKAS
ncbi:right-handed parallel beta-helix repeat-containing protein [Massilia antarctica]|uniref:Right-handed parallel beta-helix repeat-containing protein n=1 Tax=Massilia antarctica TaxID=2765360 RepID=A0AA49A6F6_9BURK|nr:right-handed parallel beta-helix repeat-containing protein [Massilia antarctica]QPI48091.1 right-handed parallel beta-helix repeat-containing protein [Massilia antarctica]